MKMDSKIIAFAIEAHEKVNHRYDGKPYSVHLAMVVGYAQRYLDVIPDQCQEIVLQACWLHDTIEDCRLTYNDILKVAGTEVANMVYALTNEKGKNRKERASEKYYEGIRNVPFARFVKLCDRLANVNYSRSTQSGMLEVYRNENNNFLSSLFGEGCGLNYQKMIDELNHLLVYSPYNV